MPISVASGCTVAAAEAVRIAALDRYQIAGTGPEEPFDAITRLAADLFRAPIAFVSLVERHRQWLKARVGCDFEQTSRSVSFCAHTILGEDVLVVPDAGRDARFADSPLVTEAPAIRFYAGAPLVTADGQRLGALCVADTVPRRRFPARDRRALKDLATMVVRQMDLRRSERARRSMAAFADTTELAMLTVAEDGRIRFVNRAATALFGYTPDEMLGAPSDLIVPERMRVAHRAGMARVAAGGATKLVGRTVEVTARRRDGSEFPIELSLSHWRGGDGAGLGAVIRDISERRDRDARLLRLANHDALTGLLNRHRFEAMLGDLYREGSAAAVLLMDLDGFKDINDTLGHATGDAILQAIAIRVPAALPREAIMARFGGDEFAVLLPGTGDPVAVQACARAILDGLAAPFLIDAQVVHVGASVGFALGPGHGRDGAELIAGADLALYRAKKAGGRVARMFLPEMQHAEAARRTTQDEIRAALAAGELVLHYQPQVCLRSGRLVGVEALIRWQHPARGLLLPGTFLPAVSMSALALPIGTWVLDRTCRQIAAWRALGLPPLRVAANLFSAQFRSGDLVRQVAEAIARHGIAPDSLELEVTERVALQNDDRSLEIVRDLRALGVGVAFDDFGTGYASLSSLKRFPLTTLKIDRSFVNDLITDARDAAITRAIIQMSTELGLETVAEGIETPEQEAALRALGCGIGQGFYYGRAMPPQALAGLLSPDGRLLARRPEPCEAPPDAACDAA